MLHAVFATTVAFGLPQAPAQDAPRVPLISYAETVRCAGLTQAASELEGGESVTGKALFDAALYWALTAGQAAQAAGKTPTASDADQTRARIEAVRQLNADAEEARSALQRCRQRTPDLG